MTTSLPTAVHHVPDAVCREARQAERWAFVAGTTGIVGNALLVALWVGSIGLGDPRWDWTGPANDVIGALSAAAMAPVAVHLARLLGRDPGLVAATVAALGAQATIVASAWLLLNGSVPFEATAVPAGLASILLMLWAGTVGRTGRRTGRLPRSLARAAMLIGVGGGVGAGLVGAAFLLPEGSVPQYVLGGLGLLLGVPAYLAFPVWMVLLASRLHDHLTGEDESQKPSPVSSS